MLKELIITSLLAVTLSGMVSACAPERVVPAPQAITPLPQEQVSTLLKTAHVQGYINGYESNMITYEDGPVEYFVHPGKEHRAQQSLELRAAGTWQIDPSGRFCISVQWSSTKTTNWCRYIFRTATGFGASDQRDPKDLESWLISNH